MLFNVLYLLPLAIRAFTTLVDRLELVKTLLHTGFLEASFFDAILVTLPQSLTCTVSLQLEATNVLQPLSVWRLPPWSIGGQLPDRFLDPIFLNDTHALDGSTAYLVTHNRHKCACVASPQPRGLC